MEKKTHTHDPNDEQTPQKCKIKQNIFNQFETIISYLEFKNEKKESNFFSFMSWKDKEKHNRSEQMCEKRKVKKYW